MTSYFFLVKILYAQLFSTVRVKCLNRGNDVVKSFDDVIGITFYHVIKVGAFSDYPITFSCQWMVEKKLTRSKIGYRKNVLNFFEQLEMLGAKIDTFE